MDNINRDCSRDPSLTFSVARVYESKSTKSKTPFAILSVSEESHCSSFCQEIATVASLHHNDVQVFCTNPLTIDSFRNSSLALRMAKVLNVDSHKKINATRK